MAQRIYLSKLIGDGLTPMTAFRPAWIDIIGADIDKTGQAIESERHHFWLGQLETDSAQHSLLQADSRIRYVNQALMSVRISELTTNQRSAIIEIFNWLGFPTDLFANTARVRDVLAYMAGRCLWHPIRQAEES